ncbi:MAG: hypothetical protein GXY48_06610 [Methanomicrobiales archaeon]|mgnify:CR=1 FL=1|nr:hypothetical protein [Methanomicrobiales archaeon]
MEPEKPLLEMISEKEAVLKKQCDIVCLEAEKIISDAKKESLLMIEIAEKEGKSASDELYQKEIAILHDDIEQIRLNGERDIEVIRSLSEKKISRVVDKIVEIITG